MNKPVLVCAAVKLNHVIFAGPRHWDETMRSQVLAVYGDNDKGHAAVRKHRNEGKEEQGFIDQYGKFYDRIEAMSLALKNKRAFKENEGYKRTKQLYSEDLY